jgi:putative MFS transporter
MLALVAASPGTSVEATGIDRYLISLFVMLSTATLFDGFDSAMMTVAAPDARQALDISRGEWGTVFAINRAGMIASFFLLLFADRWGRRAMLVLTVGGFSLFNAFTALATSKADFTFYLFLSRIFLTAAFALAVIIIGEEYPARLRGRATAILTSMAPIGVMLVAKVQPYVLLEPGAEGGWLHDAGATALVAIQGTLGLEVRLEDWRVLYLLGGLPLLLVIPLRFGMRETRRFALERSRRLQERRGVLAELGLHLRNARLPWRAQYRTRTLMVVLLWNCVHLVTAPAVAFWVIYAREDLSLTPYQVGQILFFGYAGGFAGSFLAGFLVDWIGRKRTCAAFYVFASVAIFMLFQTRTVSEQYLWMFLTVSSFGAANSATNIYSSELFPTAIRATGYGWTTNLFGRLTEVLVPLGIGLFVGTLGISWSVAVFAFGPVLGAVVVLLYAPETKGMTLEEIQDALAGPGEGAGAEPSDREVAARRITR